MHKYTYYKITDERMVCKAHKSAHKSSKISY